MSEPVTIVVSGAPVPKGRHHARIATNGKTGRQFVQEYPAAKTVKQEGYVRLLASQEMAGRAPMDGPVEVILRVLIAAPSSWARFKRQAAIAGMVRPTTRPDLDNLVKLILDACNGIVYVDDSRIVRLVAEKKYAPAGSIVATFREILAPAPLLEQATDAAAVFASEDARA